jgi:DNA repair exonuclease SbcCD ATPase subunit
LLSKEDVVTRDVTKPVENNIASFGRSLNYKDRAETALSLIAKAADIVREAENSAAEKTARAEALALQAIENLKTAHGRIVASESRRDFLETEIENLNDLQAQAWVRLQELEKMMEQTVCRLRDTEARLSIAQERENAAEDALKCIEEAITTRLLEHLGGKVFGKLDAMTDRAA